MTYRRPPRSQFVERIMPDATEADKAEASKRLFRTIRQIYRVAERLEREAPEKLPSSKPKSEPEKLSTPETLPLF